MITLRQAIVIEGKYDRMKLNGIFDAVFIETGGFNLLHSEETKELIRKFAREKGIIVLTDSDYAGLRIRSYINDFVKEGKVYNAYLPEIPGKEKRKQHAGSAGIVGVEGTPEDLIIKAVAECTGGETGTAVIDPVTPAEMAEAGLAGGKDSSARRRKFLSDAGLPQGLSTKQALKYLNSTLGPDEFRRRLGELKKD